MHKQTAFPLLFLPPGFIRKVYAILFTQLLLTTAIGAAFMASETLKTFVQARLAP